ncbi:hypothetical protein BK704_00910 [[Bacillus thuringiensis] serovar konkukian]|nr:DUF3965 domain-containing protein [Bacillus thuringiensis]ANN35490.1 hypothetical protein A9498_29140 [Bacillus thuringiensis serovar coreanensis]MED1303855.1 DUF3965 domain-containing protein [Bacillus pacificus]OUB19325.1 hypothetical protein BK704_00910 [[Bacillus thuringiensis] serovar konkukian]
MKSIQHEPNWNLVTDKYVEPQTFKDLLSLLVPKRPKGNKKERTILVWKEKEFYKKSNLIPYIIYGMKKSYDLPQFDKDELYAVLRIVRLCIEVGWYQDAYDFMKDKELVQFIETSIEYETWDIFTKTLAWNYLIVKQKAIGLEDKDHFIWERIKFNQKCIKKYEFLLSHKEIIEFMFLYVCKQAKHMSKEQLEENIMRLSVYCNSYIYDIYSLNLLSKYRKCTEFLSYYKPSPLVLACQRAVSAQISDLLHPLKTTHVDDYLFEVKEIVKHASYQFLKKHKIFIGKLLSYIPFFSMIKTLHHVYYFEEIMYICKGIGYKEKLLHDYIFIQLQDCFHDFIKYFLRNKKYAIIHEILFYWCTGEQRINLEKHYNLNFIYEKYACG